jgi:hypothetical protein
MPAKGTLELMGTRVWRVVGVIEHVLLVDPAD